MGLKLGSLDINKAYLGSTEIKKCYLGNDLVFGKNTVFVFRTTSINQTIEMPYDQNGSYTGYIITESGTFLNSYDNRFLTFSNIGDHEVTITGLINGFYYSNSSDAIDLVEIKSFGRLIVTTDSFYGCVNLNITATDTPVLSTAFMSSVFRDCSILMFNNTINEWDMSNTEVMPSMFYGAEMFNQPLNDWDTSNVTNMFSVFREAMIFNQPLNNWDTSNVSSFGSMFWDAVDFNQNIDSWQTDSMENISSMFRGATSFNQPVNSWDTSNVTNMFAVFRDATSFNQPLNNWNFNSVTNMNNFMLGKTFNDYDASNYDLLLATLNGVNGLIFANMSNVNINMGTIKYTASGASDRADLVSKGFIITDGGQV